MINKKTISITIALFLLAGGLAFVIADETTPPLQGCNLQLNATEIQVIRANVKNAVVGETRCDATICKFRIDYEDARGIPNVAPFVFRKGDTLNQSQIRQCTVVRNWVNDFALRILNTRTTTTEIGSGGLGV